MTILNKNNRQDIPFIRLIGDPTENFYQLGIKDRQGYKLLLEHISSLLKFPFGNVDRFFKYSGELGAQLLLQSNPDFKKNIEAYAEGLETTADRVAYALLTPEMSSSLGSWLPGFPTSLLGCSSFFGKNDQGNVTHTRVLDFSLTKTFEENERAISYEFQGMPKIFSFSTAGFPYPSLNAMTDRGVSLALHQKFTKVLDYKGTPIFELLYQLLNNCDSLESAVEFLEHSRCLTTWGINMSFSDGKILEADLAGDQLTYNIHKLKEREWLYLNNSTVNENENFSYPLGIDPYCEMRSKKAIKKLKSLEKLSSPTNINILKTISKNPKQKLKDSSKWTIDPITFSSVAVMTFDPKSQEVLFNTGNSPKYFSGVAAKFSNCFDSPLQKLVGRSLSPNRFHQGINTLMEAQRDLDFDRMTECYHKIQMSIELLEGYPEQHVASFFFTMIQYSHEKNKLGLHFLHKSLINLLAKLPASLRDHAYLHINRIERILDLSHSVTKESISHPKLQEIFQFDNKIPTTILHSVTSKFSHIRMDILDIIYTYTKPSLKK